MSASGDPSEVTSSPSAPAMRRDLRFAFLAQLANLGVSIGRTVLIPIMLGANLVGYGRWQAYLLYLGYISIGFLGFNDGLYVRHARMKPSEVRTVLSSAFGAYVLTLTGEAAILVVLAVATHGFGDDQALWVLVFGNLPLAGIYGALTYHLQLTGRIDRASLLVIGEKATFIVLVTGLFAAHHLDFRSLVTVEILSKLLVVMAGLLGERRSFLASRPHLRLGFQQLKANVQIGSHLMIGAYCALMAAGVVRITVQVSQSTVTFAQFAFAFSISSIILLVGQALGTVIYPRLATRPADRLGAHLLMLNRLMSVIFPLILLLYLPSALLVDKVLPQYDESLTSLGFLLVVGAFQMVASTVNNTYYRILRLESRMLTDNLVALAALVPLCLVFRDHLELLLTAQVLVIAGRTWLTQRRFRRLLNVQADWAIPGQMAWSALFLVAIGLQRSWAVAAFAAAVALLMLFSRGFLLGVYRQYLT